jgi:TrmH family RNA methyltransferase
VQLKRITSAENPRFKGIVRLLSSRGRRRSGNVVIYGMRETERALASNIEVTDVFASADAVAADAWLSLASRLEESGVRAFEILPKLFARVEFGDRADGVLAVARRPDTSLAAGKLAKSSLIVVLEDIEKPGNLGAIARTADAVGAAMLLAAPRTDPFHPNAIRSSLGAIFNVPLAADSAPAVLRWLREHGFTMFAADPAAELPYSSANFGVNTAIILGSEAAGLSAAWRNAGAIEIRLPMRGVGDSLNVSVTAAVLLFEANRQRVGASS